MEKIKDLLSPIDLSIKKAWQQLNDNGRKILFIVDAEGILHGSVTDGNIRRWILEDRSILDPVKNVMWKEPVVAKDTENKEEIRNKMLRHRVESIPILDVGRRIRDVVFWDDLFQDGEVPQLGNIDVPVVIMAGGRGTRLDPFTKILPKPLIPIGDKPILSVIMEKFGQYGVKDFFLSLNYKSNMIKAYLQDYEHSYNIHYFEEDDPRGTIGSLAMLKDRFNSTFVVSNSDIVIDADYSEIVSFHKENENMITLVCSMKHLQIPYGVVEIENGGKLKGIEEKPELDYLVLAGVYVLEPDVIRMIPENRQFDITHLIEKLMAEKQKIGVYPVSEKAWTDIGEIESYRETLRRFQ